MAWLSSEGGVFDLLQGRYSKGIPNLDLGFEHGDERPHLLRLDEKARSEHHAFARAIEVRMQPGRELEHFTDWAGKTPGAAARLTGVLLRCRSWPSSPLTAWRRWT